VKLLDFGIAQAMLRFTSEIGVLKGKFSYMSPEQIRGMPVDARTDIFSAGIILHEMLTTEKLFRGDTEFALMERVRKAEVSPPSKFNRRCPPELDAIVLRSLARDVQDRYRSAEEFANDLRKVLANYRFDPGELKELVQGIFRADFQKEQEEIAAWKRSKPADELPPETGDDSPEIEIMPSVVSAPAQTEPSIPSVPGNVDDKGSGFWSRLRSRFTR
jgi:serine/threonine protein kinase